MKVREYVKGVGGDPENDVVPVCAASRANWSTQRRRPPSRCSRAWGWTGRPEPPGAGGLPPAGPAELLHRREKEIRVDGPRRRDRPQAAGVIHTDFERGFIRAEIYSVDDLVRAGRRRSGRRETADRGKNYVMKDGTSATSCSTYKPEHPSRLAILTACVIW